MTAAATIEQPSLLVAVEVMDTPTPKGRHRARRVGGHVMSYTPAKTKRAEERIRERVAGELPHDWQPYTGPVALKVTALVAMPQSIPKFRRATARPDKRPDLPNMVMLMADALSKLVYDDDSRIVELIASKEYTDGVPRWRVEVWAP